jgi:short-subunit dehydrogenase
MAKIDLEGKNTLLTGATGGLGRAIAADLARAGARLVLSSRKSAELEQLAAELSGEGHRTVVADLGADGAPEQLLAEAGDVDVLIANAGLGGGPSLERNDTEALRNISRVNLEVPMLLAAGVRGGMIERGEGHMVFISSLAGKAIPSGTAVYAATKAGLRAFALGLRGDLAPRNVGVSVISPGFIREAGMFHDSGAKPPPGIGTATPEEVGAAVHEAIVKDRGEVEVAPLQQRAFVSFAYHFHGLGKRLERSLGGESVGQRVGGDKN